MGNDADGVNAGAARQHVRHLFNAVASGVKHMHFNAGAKSGDDLVAVFHCRIDEGNRLRRLERGQQGIMAGGVDRRGIGDGMIRRVGEFRCHGGVKENARLQRQKLRRKLALPAFGFAAVMEIHCPVPPTLSDSGESP